MWSNTSFGCLHSKKLYTHECKTKKTTRSSVTTEPAFLAYRFAISGSNLRKCRFQPSCSKFLIEAIKSEGFASGVLYGFARSQMQHDDHQGYLPTFIKDGMLLVHDPIENWK